LPANAVTWTGDTLARSITPATNANSMLSPWWSATARMLYLEFTHSQSFETFARCHIHAFQFLGGTSREIWYDNLATAVAEHDGRLVRFQPRFFAFARECGFIPRACNPAAGWEKAQASHCTPLADARMFRLATRYAPFLLCLAGRSSAGDSYKHCPLSL
jgi:hypothetical protein